MVLYHADGQVVRVHEKRLEAEAQARARGSLYTDPIDQANAKDRAAHDERNIKVRIVIQPQTFYEMNYSTNSELRGEQLVPWVENRWESEQMDRRTLMKCSSTAYDFFTFEPTKTELLLPVCYPRKHVEGQRNYKEFEKGDWKSLVNEIGKSYVNQFDDQLACIRSDEIRAYLIPWLKEMEQALRKRERALDKYPKVEIPEALLEKIHLYNAMLQLGISRYFQQPLIDELVLQMYKNKLNQCHLGTLEMTVGRFYSRGIAVLDPVINHLIGTYALRSADDRNQAEPSDEDKDGVLIPLSNEEDAKNRPVRAQYMYLEKRPPRNWLTYQEVRAGRLELKKDLSLEGEGEIERDTVLHPPKLEVIGACIRNWSGIRRSGSTAAAHTGYPLNVGRVTKYYRRRATSPIRKRKDRPDRIDVAKYSTYRLHNLHNDPSKQDEFEYFRTHGPGGVAVSAPAAAEE